MAEMFTFDDVQAHWPRFDVEADKYSRGVVGIDTGSQRYPGAGVLSVLGALNSGAGFIRYVGPEAVRDALLVRAPSVTFSTGTVDAWVVGCGWDDAGSAQRWDHARQSGVPLVVDAGALGFDDYHEHCLLTPHVGELARILGVDRQEVAKTPDLYALQVTDRYGCTVLVKGHRQYLAHHDGTVVHVQPGLPGLARAGSGDVLAGVAGTLLAQTQDTKMAGLLAAGFQAWVSTLHPGAHPPDHMAEFMADHVPGLDLLPSHQPVVANG